MPHTNPHTNPPADLDSQFAAYGLVDIHTLDPSIGVDLMYASTDNFTHTNMYGALSKAYLLPEIADMVLSAQRSLRRERPECSLLIRDAARPLSIQRYMFNLVKGTPGEIYVANPGQGGGCHNYGTAVDITVTDGSGAALDMGSPVDHFGELSHRGSEPEFVRRGMMSADAMRNRAWLTGLMVRAGFDTISHEWWHFQKYSMDTLRTRFRLLDF